MRSPEGLHSEGEARFRFEDSRKPSYCLVTQLQIADQLVIGQSRNPRTNTSTARSCEDQTSLDATRMFGASPSLSSSCLKHCPLVTEQCISRPRRAAKGSLWICAGDKRQKLEEQVVSTNKVALEVVVCPCLEVFGFINPVI